MTPEEFAKIEQWDVVEFQRDNDAELEKGVVLKKGRNALLAGIDGGRGFWHPASPTSIVRVVRPFRVAEQTEVKKDISAAIDLLRKVDMAI
jgi:hypothetical protein